MTDKNTKQIAALVHALIRREAFSSYADLKAKAAHECARLRLPYDSDTIGQAITLVERSRPVVRP